METGDILRLTGLRDGVRDRRELTVENSTQGTEYAVRHRLSARQVDVLLAGGIIAWLRERDAA